MYATKKPYSFDSSIGVDYATLPMTGIGKPRFIFVWLVWVENRQPMTDKVETNF